MLKTVLLPPVVFTLLSSYLGWAWSWKASRFYVERESQKGIIIGHQGVALKKVSTEARKALEKFFDKPIYLETFVKVDKDWRSSQRELDAFGYNPE